MSRYSHLPTRILNWRTAFLIIRELLVFSKNRLCWLSPKPCWLNLVRDPMCVPVGNRTCPPSAEETGVDSFRKLACLCTPYTLPGEAVLSGMRRWAGGEIYQIRTPTFSPLSILFVPFQVPCVSTGPACSRTMRSQRRLNNSLSPRGAKSLICMRCPIANSRR